MIRPVTLIALGILLTATTAFSREVTLEECLKRALDENSGLKAAGEDTRAAREESAMAFKSFLPTLRLLGDYTIVDKSPRLVIYRDAFGAGMPGADTELTLGEKNFYSLTLNLQQPLFTGGVLTGSYRKARAKEVERGLHRDRRKRELIFEVKKAFHTSLAEQHVHDATGKMLQAKKERLRVLRELHREGYTSRDDVLQQEADVLFTELELLKSGNRAASSRTRLAHLAHLDDNPDLHLAAASDNSTLTVTIEEIRAAALAHREDLQAGRQRISMASADVSIARSGFFPQASLTGSFQQQKETGIMHPQVWSLTATLDWSLFEWGKTVNEVRRAAARKQQELFNQDELTRLATQETEQAWRSVKEQELAVSAHESQTAANAYRLATHTRKYHEGQIKLADLLAAEAGFTKAHNDYLSAVAQLASERARLEYVAATELDSWTVPKQLYRPTLTTVARSVIQSPGETPPSGTAAPPSLVAPRTKPPVAPTQPDSAAEPNPSSTNAAETFAIQVGAYTVPDGAKKVTDALSRKTGTRTVHISKAGKFSKVRISGFASREEAEEFAQNLSLNEYLIVRTTNGL